jgi:hypothetical protein
VGNNETNEYPFGEYKFNDTIDEKMKVHLVTTNTMIILMEK